ncbi:hypothetical protein GGX14DRAFT_384504 [Mycena pura]|uniref:Uncharacterized protein n=1 Tax=Mycena pura TaxID=153505 RepID=A0AAD6YWG3_9AGAR|nr:hypothetical protein GGX14DRAFT_384504 [Mycena pura]
MKNAGMRAPRTLSIVTECHAQERRSCALPEALHSLAELLLTAWNGKCIAGWQVHVRCGDLRKKRRHSACVHRAARRCRAARGGCPRKHVEKLAQGRHVGVSQLEAHESMQRGKRRTGGTRVPGARVANGVVSSAWGGDGEAVQRG